MSDYGLFEADTDAQNAPERQRREASTKLANAIDEIRDRYGDFLLTASGKDEFEDRWHYSKADIRKSAEAAGVFPNTGTMRRIHDAIKRERFACDDTTVTDKQKSKIDKGEKPDTDDVETNSGDGSDAEGKGGSKDDGFGGKKAPPFGKNSSLAEAPNQNLAEGREVSDSDLIPDATNDYDDNGQASKVERNFSEGGDTGREASRIARDLYVDWAKSNGMRVASLNTLEYYGETGINDATYSHLANIIIQGECDCEDDKDTDGPEGDDTDSDGPPKGAAEKGGDSDEDDSDESDDSEGSSDDGGDSAPSDDGGNPFGGDNADADSAGPPDDGGSPDDGGFAGPPEAPDVSDDGGDPAAAAGDPADDFGAPAADDGSGGDFPDAAGPGDEFAIPETPPQLAPEEQGAIAEDTSGTDSIPPEIIDEILGLPPGTVEQLVLQELSGGGGAPPGGPPPPPSAQQLARKLYRDAMRSTAAEDPSGGADPAAGGQSVAPATPAPAPTASPTQPGPDDGALLDQASQAVTQLVDTKTQEFQTVMDPLQQALQAIQFAQQVEQAANPLDVTPPEGTVDVSPSQAPAAQAAPPAAQPAAQAAPNGGLQQAAHKLTLQRRAFKIAHHYGLSEKGYKLVTAAMSRRQYEHVAEAIQTLPAEHRVGIAASLADMFREDNVRFNTGAFMQQAGVAPAVTASSKSDRAGDSWRDGKDRANADTEEADTDPDNWEDREARRLGLVASRHPFAVRSATGIKIPVGGQTMDAYEPKGKAAGGAAIQPKFDDNINGNELPKMPGAPVLGGVSDAFSHWEKGQEGKGLGYGGDEAVHGFADSHKVGPRGLKILHEQVGVTPEPAAKVASFEPKVAGWSWDNHLNGYVTSKRRPFVCTTAGCDTEVPTPSYVNCRCGRIWNTYAIGDSQHLASGEADMFIAREIAKRENVIMANRQFAAEENDAEDNVNSDGPYQDYPEDVEFYTDEEIDENTAHAPGETDVDGTKTAASYGDDDHNVSYRDGQAFCSACDAMLWDPNVHHCPAKQAYRTADWTKFDDDDNAGYEEGPDGPPSTSAGSVPKDWAKRGDGGKWLPPTFK